MAIPPIPLNQWGFSGAPTDLAPRMLPPEEHLARCCDFQFLLNREKHIKYIWCIFEANLSAQYICTRKIHLPHSLHTTNVCHDTPYTKQIRSFMPAHTHIHAHAHTHLILEKINKIGEKIRLCTGWSLELPLHALGCAVIEPAACLPACASSAAWSSAATRQKVKRSLTNRGGLEG